MSAFIIDRARALAHEPNYFVALGLVKLSATPIFTETYTSSPQEWDRECTALGQTITGYYSDKAPCNRIPGAGEGSWKAPNDWISTCHGVGTKRPLTLLELCAAGNTESATVRNAFIESITDQGGNKKKPQACGGSDPNIYTYNPLIEASAQSAPIFAAIDEKNAALMGGIIQNDRLYIFIIIGAIFSALIIKKTWIS